MVRRTTRAVGDRVCVTRHDRRRGARPAPAPGVDARLGGGARATRIAPSWSTATGIRARASPWRRRCARHARAAMDISDGLAGDLAKMLRASGRRRRSTSTASRCREAAAPRTRGGPACDRRRRSPAATITRSSARWRPRASTPSWRRAPRAGVPLACIGTVTAGATRRPSGTHPAGASASTPGSFSHF